jgi:hypothetical protein
VPEAGDGSSTMRPNGCHDPVGRAHATVNVPSPSGCAARSSGPVAVWYGIRVVYVHDMVERPGRSTNRPMVPRPVVANSTSPKPSAVGTRRARPSMSGHLRGRPTARESLTCASSTPDSSIQGTPTAGSRPNRVTVAARVSPRGWRGLAAGLRRATEAKTPSSRPPATRDAPATTELSSGGGRRGVIATSESPGEDHDQDCRADRRSGH